MAMDGTSANDFLEGTEDDDTIMGLEGDDIIYGMDENDSLNGNQNKDQIFGGAGSDTIHGGMGLDFVVGGLDNDLLYGDRGNDTVLGDFGNDAVVGGLGNDFVNGNVGNDLVYGDEGDDKVYGGQNCDTVYGGAGNDYVSGDRGSDLLFGDENTDTLFGFAGKDIFVLQKKFAANRTPEADIITDFTEGEDLLGLEPDLTFNELRIFQEGESEFSRQTIIADKNTGRIYTILKGIESSTIDETDFTTRLISDCEDFPGETPDDSPPTLNFSAPSYSVKEGSGAFLNVKVNREGSPREIVTVDYATTDGTARAGSDFPITGGSLTFNPFETSQSFTFFLLNDLIEEGNETFNLVLKQPLGGAILGDQSTATVTIQEDESQSQVQFEEPGYSVAENARTATITVNLPGVSESPVSVNFSTRDGTAVADTDYDPITSGQLYFVPGETAKTFTVRIKDDQVVDGDKTVFLTLSDPTGGTLVRDPATVLLTILDDETTTRVSPSAIAPNSGTLPRLDGTLIDAEFRADQVTFEDLAGSSNVNLKFDVANSGGTTDPAILGSSVEPPHFHTFDFPFG